MELAVPGDYEVWIAKDGECLDRLRFLITHDDLKVGFDLHDPLVSDLISALANLEKDRNSWNLAKKANEVAVANPA